MGLFRKVLEKSGDVTFAVLNTILFIKPHHEIMDVESLYPDKPKFDHLEEQRLFSAKMQADYEDRRRRAWHRQQEGAPWSGLSQ